MSEPRPNRPSRGAGASAAPTPRGPEDDMARKGWTTIALPTEVYDEIKKHHVPGRAKSVQNYILFWARAGSLIDHAVESADDAGKLADRILEALAQVR